MGGWDAVDAHEMLALYRRVNCYRDLPFLVAPRLSLHSTLGIRSPVDYENRTLGQRGAGLAASRLAPASEMIKEKDA